MSDPCTPSTQVEIDGFTWTIYADTTATTIEQIVKVSQALAKRGYRPPMRASGFGGARPVKPLAQPRYNDAGDPCCNVHLNRNGQPTPLRFIGPKDGRPGFWGCPSQAQQVPGETVNARGYCDLRFSVEESKS